MSMMRCDKCDNLVMDSVVIGVKNHCSHCVEHIINDLRAEVKRLKSENMELTEELGRRVIKMESDRKRGGGKWTFKSRR